MNRNFSFARIKHYTILSTLAASITIAAVSAQATTVQFQTVMGDFEVNLFDKTTPKTVENFLKYVKEGAFENTIIHRSVPDFIVQGGGFELGRGAPFHISDFGPLVGDVGRQLGGATPDLVDADLPLSRLEAGGGVLADWIVDLAEHNGYIAQATSVAGVAQRTGATIYYVEMFPRANAERAGAAPLLGLMRSAAAKVASPSGERGHVA